MARIGVVLGAGGVSAVAPSQVPPVAERVVLDGMRYSLYPDRD